MRYLLACCWVVLSLGAASCLESQQSVCGDDDDCSGNQVCRSGVCQLPSDSCTSSRDCAPDEVCIDDRCRAPNGIDATLPDTSPSPDSGDEMPGDTRQDTPTPDRSPPEFQSIDPADRARDVSVDTMITVTFDEEIRDTSITQTNVALRGPANASVETTLTQPSPTEIAIEPNAPLRRASPYTVELGEDLRDDAGNRLGETLTFTFSTAAPTVERHRTLARDWAPVVHQGIYQPEADGPAADIPTRIDFDGDRNASNNGTNARTGDLPAAHVYYHVTESKTHTFIHYIFYYTNYSDDKGSTYTDHHFAGATFTIERESQTLLSVDGIDLDSNSLDWVAFTPESANLSTLGSTLTREELDTSTWSLIDGRRYPMWIKAGTHETCHWRASGAGSAPAECVHNSESFLGDAGVVMTPGDTAETYAEAEPPQNSPDAHPEMSYKLLPLSAEMWAVRRPFGSEAFFASGFVYEPSPDGNTRPVGFNDTAHVLPTAMASQNTDSFGRTPFRWQSFSGASSEGRGQWLLDPAHIAGERYDFSARSAGFVKDYCYNLFFDVDERGSTNCPS